MLLLGLLLHLLAPAPTSSAHASLEASVPTPGAILDAAPDKAGLVFSEPVTPAVDGFRLIGPDRSARVLPARIEGSTIAVDLPDDLPRGTHLLSWRVISADSHPISGVITFAVGAPSPDAPIDADARGTAAETANVLGRGLVTLGVLLTVGLVLVEALVLRRRGPASVQRAVRVAGLLGIVAAVVNLPLEWVALQGVGPGALANPASWVGVLGGPTAIAAALGVVGLGLVVLMHRLTPSASRNRVLRGGAALAVCSLVATGHTRTYGPVWAMVGADVAHVVVGSFWLGGVLALGLVLRSAADDAVVVVRRFSTAAAVSVVVLAVSGATMAVLVLQSWSDLLDTGYGRALLVKLGLVLVVLAVAGWNRFALLPRLSGAGPDGLTGLRRALRHELGLLVAVVLVTGVLISADPVPSVGGVHQHSAPTSGPQTLALADVEATVLVTPARVGTNSVLVTLRDADGRAVEPEQDPTLAVSLPAEQLGPLRPVLTPTSLPGEYRGEVDLPLSGEWELALAVRTSELSETVGSLSVAVVS